MEQPANGGFSSGREHESAEARGSHAIAVSAGACQALEAAGFAAAVSVITEDEVGRRGGAQS